MTAKRLHIFLILLLGWLVAAAPALGASSTSASAEFAYAHYEADGDNGSLEASSFTQQYSFLRRMEGEIAHGRLGGYKLGLGAEWNLADIDLNGQSDSLDTLKILYEGEFVLAPGGLPFRLQAYSRDRHGSFWVKDMNLPSTRNEGLASGSSGPVIDPDITTDIANGQHIETGVMLLVGIRNGSYRGRYRDILSKMPRLLLDYRETLVRNLHSFSPQKYRFRDLAFVSLNKKDNWFHYRVKDYTDFLKSGNNSKTKTIMLGTIDHTLRRHWINLTNWIKVSVDGALIEDFKENNGGQMVERYEFNLFGKAHRTKWNLENLNTFSRSMEAGVVTRAIDVPVLLEGEVDRNTGYRFRLVGSSDAIDGDVSIERSVATVNASARVETFRLRPFILTSEVLVDVKQGTEGEGLTVRAGAEARSNRRFEPKYHLVGSYFVKRFGGTSNSGGDVEFWEHEAAAGVSTDVTSSLRTSFNQRFVYGTGTVDSTVSSSIRSSGAEGLSRSVQDNSGVRGDIFKSSTMWTLDHETNLRMRNHFAASFEYLSNDGSKAQTSLAHKFSYHGRRLNFKLANEVVFGSGISASGAGVSSSSVRRTMHHGISMQYTPGRSWGADLKLDYTRNVADEGEFSLLDGEQKYRYSLYTINGIIRRLAQVNQSLRFVKSSDLWGATRWDSEFTLSGTYYPTKQTLLGARVGYQFGTDDTDYQTVTFGLTAGVNFQKLQANIEYEYGTRDIDGDGVVTGNSDEQRWEITLKKIF